MKRPFWQTFSVLGISTLVLASCASEQVADPVPVDLAVEFPSTPAAVVTDSVRFFVFEGERSCSELVTIRKTGRPLPTTLVERRTNPCALDTSSTADVPRGRTYTVLVAAQVADKDFLIGCSVQVGFGDVVALPVSLDYASNELTLSTIESQTPGATTRCAKFSDRCNNTCAK